VNIDTMQVAIFWVVALCSGAVRIQRFGGQCCFQLQGAVAEVLQGFLKT